MGDGKAYQTEILGTAGPASIDLIARLYEKGMSGLRINSSHGDKEFHARAISESRKADPKGYIVYDIKGPKIRIGDLPEPLKLKSGMRLDIRTDIPRLQDGGYPRISSFDQGIPVTFATLHEYVREGDKFFIDDGYIGLRVLSVSGSTIRCEVMYGDLLRSRKGLNHPDTIIGYPYTMPQDIPNLEFAVGEGVDFIADSFTRNGDDVRELRKRLAGTGVLIISKIENPEGVDNFDEILKETDAIMIARGDLGVEIDPWKLPELQKVMIEKCNAAGRPVITATQMLESMIDNPRPSRADVSDIANAIYDGTDVVMLSAETSVGHFPEEAVWIMGKTIENVEHTVRYRAVKKGFHGLVSLAGNKR